MAYELITIRGLCVDASYLIMGPLANNVYILSDGTKAMVVDPTQDAKAILDALGGLELEAIVITHAHWDHTGAAAELRDASGAPVIASEIDAPMLETPQSMGTSRDSAPCIVDRRVKNGDTIQIGNVEWKVISTPGHSKGSICLFCIPQNGIHPSGLPVLVSGDTLFNGTTGRTDFEGGSIEDMARSMKKLAALPDDTAVLPGHDSLTTIGNERRTFAMYGWEPDHTS